jgi:hypothetical protein
MEVSSQTSHHGRFSAGEIGTGTYWIGGWVVLDPVEKRKIVHTWE